MKTFPDLIVCEHCDSVYRRRTLAAGETAQCVRCAAPLYRASRLDADRWLALTLAAAIAFVIANVCPVVHVGFQGLYNEATLWQSAAVLARGPIAVIALPVALSIIVIPCVQIGLLAWILIPARTGRRAPGFAPALRALALLRPWSMIEVCLLGILVSAIKLSHFLQISPGAGFWATAGLMVLITLIANRSVQRLWEWTARETSAGAGA